MGSRLRALNGLLLVSSQSCIGRVTYTCICLPRFIISHFGPGCNVVMTCIDDGVLEQGYRCVVLVGSDVQATQSVETSESCIWVLSIA
jgi:hypothetical protein